MTKNRQSGFTIIELMIATTVFAVLLLISAATVVRFTKNFQKGVTETNTQNVARSIIDTMSQELQFEGDYTTLAPSDTGSPYIGYCIGSTKYSYILGKQLEDQVPHVLIEQHNTGSNCGNGEASDLSGSVTGQELIAAHMRLANFKIEAKGGNLYSVTIRVAYGDDDLLCSQSKGDCGESNNHTSINDYSTAQLAEVQCKPGIASQYCAVSELTTTVKKRLAG